MKNIFFFAPGILVDPLLARTVCGPCCPPAAPSDHWYGGLCVLLGDSEAWKPQKVGGCGWIWCPRNSVFSHVAQDTARSWFWACLSQTTHIWTIFGHFWAVSRTYRGARGQERALCHGAIKAHVEFLNCFPSFGRFDWLSGPFWAKKKAVFGAQNRNFGRAPPDLAPPPRGATG